MFGKRPQPAMINQEQFDAAARALHLYFTGEGPAEPFAVLENDRWWVMARVALEGAGVRVA